MQMKPTLAIVLSDLMKAGFRWQEKDKDASDKVMTSWRG